MNNFKVKESVFFVAFTVVFTFCFTDANAQYFVKTKIDSNTFTLDSVVLTVGNASGIFEWQKSTDTLTWKPLQHMEDSLWIRIDSSAFYRLKLSVENCDPVYSDIALVSFRSVIVNGNTFLLEPEGGVYSLSSGIRVVVPPGAVRESITVSVSLLDSLASKSQIPLEADTAKSFGAGILIITANDELLKPIRIRVPVPKYESDDIPVLFQFDNTSDSWEKKPADFICSQQQKFIEFPTSYLNSSRIHLIPDVLSFSQTGGRVAEDKCREGLIRIETSAHDYIGSLAGKECFVTKDELQVTFLECNNQKASAIIQEIGKNCRPNVSHTLAKDCLEAGERTTLEITVTIGGMPLKGQNVKITVPNGLTTDYLNKLTSSEGKASFSIGCTVPKFSGSLSYSVDYKYFLSVVTASDGTQSEASNQHPVSDSYTKSASFRQCPYPYTLQIITDCPGGLYPGQTCKASAWCQDQYGDPIDCGSDIQITEVPSYTGSGAISIVEQSGMIIANKGGVGKIKAVTSTLESQELSLPVAFQGSVDINDTKDYTKDWYDIMCGCPEDKVNDPDFRYYKVTYIGSMQISLWPSIYESAPPTIQMTGSSVTSYSIVSLICNDASFTENFSSMVADAIDPALGRQPTSEEVLSGNAFQILIAYQNFRSELVTIKFNAGYIWNTSSIDLYQSGDFIPESCIGRINSLFLKLY
ncbi:MAG: hypothetical protein U5K79_16255 [Cyclobacteriaceae bacterium]|nr:hypothetical protein [Cyclobacteriaceae bacterium]